MDFMYVNIHQLSNKQSHFIISISFNYHMLLDSNFQSLKTHFLSLLNQPCSNHFFQATRTIGVLKMACSTTKGSINLQENKKHAYNSRKISKHVFNNSSNDNKRKEKCEAREFLLTSKV